MIEDNFNRRLEFCKLIMERVDVLNWSKSACHFFASNEDSNISARIFVERSIYPFV